MLRVVISILRLTSDHVSGLSDWFTVWQLWIPIGQNKAETFCENNILQSDEINLMTSMLEETI